MPCIEGNTKPVSPCPIKVSETVILRPLLGQNVKLPTSAFNRRRSSEIVFVHEVVRPSEFGQFLA